MKRNKYSLDEISELSEIMRQYDFDYAFISDLDGDFVCRKEIAHEYFTVNVSYAVNDEHMLIWIEEGKSDLYSGGLPKTVVYGNDLIDFVYEILAREI